MKKYTNVSNEKDYFCIIIDRNDKRYAYYIKKDINDKHYLGLKDSCGHNSTNPTFQNYSYFSKLRLEQFQLYLLKAYVHCIDEKDRYIEESFSKESLDKIKETILAIRDHLRNVTKYIDVYDEITEEYKDI